MFRFIAALTHGRLSATACGGTADDEDVILHDLAISSTSLRESGAFQRTLDQAAVVWIFLKASSIHCSVHKLIHVKSTFISGLAATALIIS